MQNRLISGVSRFSPNLTLVVISQSTSLMMGAAADAPLEENTRRALCRQGSQMSRMKLLGSKESPRAQQNHSK